MLRTLHVGVDAEAKDVSAESSFSRDARALEALARTRGADTTLLVGERATASNVTAELARLVEASNDGDTLLVTIASHGARTSEATVEMILLAPHNGQPTSLDDHDVWRSLEPLWSGAGRDVTVAFVVDACSSDRFVDPEHILGTREEGVAVVLLRRLFALVRRAARRRTQKRSRFEGFSPALAAATEIRPVRLHIYAAAGKNKIAYDGCGPEAARRGCFSLAVEAVARDHPHIPFGELDLRVAERLRQRSEGQVPVYSPLGAALPADPFL